MKNKIEHKNYIVYSTVSIDKEMYNILDSIDNIVVKCVIYQPNVKHINYDTFMSKDIKQNDILVEMFKWSETH